MSFDWVRLLIIKLKSKNKAMKKSMITISLVLCFIIVGYAQNDNPMNRSCSVVCLNDNWIPESYDRDAKNTIDINSKGVLSVHETNDVSDRINYNKKDFIAFKIAIFKKEFDSIVSFSDDTYTTINAREVLEECQKGDQILIMLKDSDRFSLPHHRIDVL